MPDIPQAEIVSRFPGDYLSPRQPFFELDQLWHVGQLATIGDEVDVERVVVGHDNGHEVTPLTLVDVHRALPEATRQDGYCEPAEKEMIYAEDSLVFRRELPDGRSYYQVHSAASLCLAPFFGQDGSYWGWGNGVYLRWAYGHSW